jgi:ribonuclease HII
MNPLHRHDAVLLERSICLVGVDEAGRGALAGPVVAAACVIGRGFVGSARIRSRVDGADDSKRLSPAAREALFDRLCALRADGLIDFAVGEGSVGEIERRNILGATLLAMRRALETLAGRGDGWTLPAAMDGPLFPPPSNGLRILVDGLPLKRFPYAHDGLVGGDGRSLCIALASIVAKVSRDRRMAALDRQHPLYGFARHKGYGTAAHRRALSAHGPSPQHRRLFLRKVLKEAN